MKKLFILILGVLFLIGCAKKEGSSVEDRVTLRVGATYPLVEILNQAKDDLKSDGVDLEVIEFNDYVTPNIALDEGEIDANLFQHIPYLEGFNKNKGTDLVGIGNVLIAPIGIYSKKYKSLNELPNKSTFGISNSPVDQGRCLLILQEAGLITLDPSKGINADLTDIVENKKEIQFKVLDAAMLARSLSDLDATFINGNFAIQAGLKPNKDAIYREGKNSPYVNIIAVKRSNKDNEDLHRLVAAIQTEKIKNYIENNFDGAFIAAF